MIREKLADRWLAVIGHVHHRWPIIPLADLHRTGQDSDQLMRLIALRTGARRVDIEDFLELIITDNVPPLTIIRPMPSSTPGERESSNTLLSRGRDAIAHAPGRSLLLAAMVGLLAGFCGRRLLRSI